MSEFVISGLHTYAGIQVVANNFNSGAYDTLFEATACAVEDRLPNAQEVPAVQFGLDAVFGALQQATLHTTRPPVTEIHDRSRQGRLYAREIAAKMIQARLLVKMYSKHPDLSWLFAHDKDLAHKLSDVEHFGSLLGAAFRDATIGIGGAHRKLTAMGITDGLQALITSSRGLSVISRLPDAARQLFRAKTGDPYTLPQHLKIVGNNQVTFGDYAHSLIRRWSTETSGCPALKITPVDYERNVLDESWRQFVAYLVAENATSEAEDDRHPVPSKATRAARRRPKGRRRAG